MKALGLAALTVSLGAVGCGHREGAPPPPSATAPQATEPVERGSRAQGEPRPAAATTPEAVPRVPVEEARLSVQAGEALLVCAYPSEERCEQVALEGSISWAALERRLPSLPEDTRLIFYCG